VKNNQRVLRTAIICLAAILSAGCAALTPLASKQETLEERVKNYMQAQIEGKWDLAYSFFDASSRDKETRENYVNRSRTLSYKKFAIEEITLLPSGEQATVKVRIDIALMGYVFPRAPQTQSWVKEKGAWFLKLAPPGKNPFTKQEKQP
jgi:hypothetical protein